ncbi:MAG: cytochrome bc1 complex diheme cytochrome c subunit, partial [Kineosporiaceae bacterium]
MSTSNQQSEAPIDEVHGHGGGTDGPAARARARRRSKRRRRLANVSGLMAALVLTGVVYSFLSPANAADDGTSSSSSAEDAGKALYERSCITCHGENLQGVPGRGPSLIGAGEAAVYFQVHTGRMPLVRQGPQAGDKPPVFSEKQIDQLMAYVQANGGGPTLPSGDLRAGGDLAEGGELFRLNCASCHNFTGEGGAL